MVLRYLWSKRIPVLLFGAGCIVSARAHGELNPWQVSMDKAKVEAQRSGKPMLIDFRADWCAPCKAMDTEVYTQAFLGAASSRFLPVRIDVDKARAVAREYNVVNLPTTIFADSLGDELFRYSGFLGPNAMAALLDALPSDIGEFNRLSGILRSDKNNFKALVAMGKSLRDVGLYRTSNEYYARSLQQPEGRLPGSSREMILTQTGLNFLDLKQGVNAAKAFERCLKEFPSSVKVSEWAADLAQSNMLEGMADKPKRFSSR